MFHEKELKEKKEWFKITRTLNPKPINHETLWKARLNPKNVDHDS